MNSPACTFLAAALRVLLSVELPSLHQITPQAHSRLYMAAIHRKHSRRDIEAALLALRLQDAGGGVAAVGGSHLWTSRYRVPPSHCLALANCFLPSLSSSLK